MLFGSDVKCDADGSASERGGLASYEALQQLMLVRYARLGKLRRAVVPRLDPSDYRIKLIDRALYATYRDLLALGLTSEALLLRERMLSGREPGVGVGDS